MNNPRKRTRRGVHYRALAEGYAMLHSPIAESFHHAADHFDQTDPPDPATEVDKADANAREGRRSISVHDHNR